jgi:superfamily II DNA or RNA helicase
MAAYISGLVYLRKSLFSRLSLADRLTITYRKMGDRTAYKVNAWVDRGAYVGVPRSFGLQLIAKLGIAADDRMSGGYIRKYPVEIAHTGQYAYQKNVVNQMLACCEDSNDFLMSAATGKGKSTMALSVIQKLGTTAIILVDQSNLMEQWVSRIRDELGLREDQIGIVRGPKCDYRKKHVVVAMVQTLVRKEFDPGFLDYFGVVVVDEVHTVGAPVFSQVMGMFSAAIRFGMSATVQRGDALQQLLHLNLGEVAVELKDKHDTSYVYYLESHTVYSWYANISPKTGRILSEISEDTERNVLIAEAVRWLYDSGRDVLVLSDRIEQLEALMVMVGGLGVPENDLGLYCGYRNVLAFEKDPTPPARPHGYVRGTEYTPVRLTYLKKKIAKAQKDKVLQSARVIFATYGMFAKGVDVPRLSGGIDCTPRAKAEQVHGRILRAREGKLVPIWVTIRDVNSYRTEFQFAARIRQYAASSAEVYQWKMEKGVKKKDVQALSREATQNSTRLKKLNVETRPDGSYMLVTKGTRSG